MPRARAVLALKAGREKSVAHRHPWIFSGAIERVDGAAGPGETVAIHTDRGEFLALAAFSPASQIRARIWTFADYITNTEGEIFATRSGSLRYVTDRKNPPTWIVGSKKTTLTVVPIESVDDKTGEPINNYQLIYNELGVYLGEKLGNPCDDL